MNIALFASGKVGLEMAKVFGEKQEPLACLVVDPKAGNELNMEIIAACSVAQEKVFCSHLLYTAETLSALKGMKLDLIILAWWPYIIQPTLLDLPRIGCLNFHPSYLPYNRGKHYNFWAIVENVPFGVTLHFADKGVDEGDIAYQSMIDTSWEDTGGSLYYKAQESIVQLFKDKFCEIKSGYIPRTRQDLRKGSVHKSDELEAASRIDLDRKYKGRELLNLLRARTFPPHPGAWFIDDGRKYEVRIEIKEVTNRQDDEG